MLYFITPLRAKAASKNWEVEMECFERMYNSVLGQTCDDYHFVLVCHDVPECINPASSKVSIIQLEGELPTTKREQSKDKTRKTDTGFDFVTTQSSGKDNFVMLLDADDLLNKHLVEYVSKHAQENGWYIGDGYEYSYSTGKIIPLQKIFGRLRFDAVCGSSFIVKLNEKTAKAILSGHDFVAQNCAKAGFPLQKLPFRGAVYVINTGNNHSLLSIAPKTGWRKYFPTTKYLKMILRLIGVFTKDETKDFPELTKMMQRKY